MIFSFSDVLIGIIQAAKIMDIPNTPKFCKCLNAKIVSINFLLKVG